MLNMRADEKLRLIKQLTNLSQQEMANRLGVSHATLSSWILGKSKPRQRFLESIDKLFTINTTGQQASLEKDLLSAKRAIINSYKTKFKQPLKIITSRTDLKDEFILALTYTSNSIEGSTLTSAETASVIFDNVTLPNKSLIEHFEAKNHQSALLQLFLHLLENKKLNLTFVLELHKTLMTSIREDAGYFRTHAVRILNSSVVTANHMKVPQLMKNWSISLDKKFKNPIFEIAKIHAKFEKIHPFSDGNGRIGRLICHAILFQHQLPCLIIKKKERIRYFKALEKAQIEENYSELEELFMDGIIESYKLLT